MTHFTQNIIDFNWCNMCRDPRLVVIKKTKKPLKRLGQCNQFLAARKRQILCRTN